MSGIELQGGLDAEPGEKVILTFRPNRASYIRSHLIMAVIGSVIAGAGLYLSGNPHPWVGPVGAIIALTVRGWFLMSEMMGFQWQLTSHRLIIPGGRAYRLSQITRARKFLSDVQIITSTGDKHLIRYPADQEALVAAIEAAKAGARP